MLHGMEDGQRAGDVKAMRKNRPSQSFSRRDDRKVRCGLWPIRVAILLSVMALGAATTVWLGLNPSPENRQFGGVAQTNSLASNSDHSDKPYSPRSPRSVTFCKDIAAIIWTHCAPCHRSGQVAPFDLLTYT